MRRLGIAAAVFLLGCGGGARSPSGSAADGAEPPAPGPVGAPCKADSDCLSEHCFVNEYAGFGWCSAPCDPPGEPCPDSISGSAGAFCLEFPSEFPDEPRRFCVPTCASKYDCEALTPLWETCAEPAWKGNPLPGTLTGVQVCAAPSAQGRPKVDPETCADWQAGFAGFAKQIQTCTAYCDFLVTCHVVLPPYNEDCCAYGCTLRATAGGEVQEPYEKRVQCYEQAMRSYPPTIACSEALSQCGDRPEDPSP